MTEPTESYLGDGCFASYDGFQFTLRAPRGEQQSDYVVLEPEVLESFHRYIEAMCGVKITVTKVEKQEAI